MLKIKRFTNWAPVALAFLLAAMPALAAPPSGGGSKITVTAASPSEAAQGEELDVIVTGSGFDAGSTVSYLVTGTTDASQVQVISVQFISSTQLKTRIRPKDAALATVYDIEVRTLSGRKGKGTTLFSVKLAETACTGSEPKEPEIVYLTGLETQGDLYTQGMYLSSGSGCDQFLLLSEAVQIRPAGNGSDPKAGQEYLSDVVGVRLDVEGDQGVVVWADRSMQPVPLLSLRFTIEANADIAIDPLGPQLAYLPPDGYNVYYADVRFNELGDVEVVVAERIGNLDWRLAYVNLDSGVRVSLGEGACPFQSNVGECYGPLGSIPFWDAEGVAIYFNANSADTSILYPGAMVRIQRNSNLWYPAELLMKHSSEINVLGIRPDGVLAYRWLHYVPRRNGRTSFQETYFVTATVNPDDCVLFECSPLDGFEMAAEGEKFPQGWTRDGGMLFVEQGTSTLHLKKYSDPLSGAVGTLDIENVDRDERDTSY